MTAVEELSVEYLKRTMYQRIQLAAAVFVIRTTPDGKSLSDHAADLQQRLRVYWMNSSFLEGTSKTSLCAHQRILSQQQDILSSNLCSLLPPFVEDYTILTSHEKSPNVIEPRKVNFENIKEIRSKLQDTANFVQTVLQLKTLAETQETVSIEDYARSISKLYERQRNFPPQSQLQSAESRSALFGAPQSELASSVLLYMVNSCNTEELLKKSLQGILHHMRIVACEARTQWSVTSLEEIINEFDESIYQQALNALQNVLCMNAIPSSSLIGIRNMSYSFIQEIISVILDNKVDSKMDYATKESQILLLLKISEGMNLWVHSLEFSLKYLMQRVDLLRAKYLHLCEVEHKSTNFCQRKDLMIEKHKYFQEFQDSAFLFLLVRTFLQGSVRNIEFEKQKHKGAPTNPVPSSEHQTSCSIGDLWRRHYNVPVNCNPTQLDIVRRDGGTKSDIRRWKRELKKIFGNMMFEHPITAALYCECVHLLPSLNI